jgi:hypothetical protein
LESYFSAAIALLEANQGCVTDQKVADLLVDYTLQQNALGRKLTISSTKSGLPLCFHSDMMDEGVLQHCAAMEGWRFRKLTADLLILDSQYGTRATRFEWRA